MKSSLTINFQANFGKFLCILWSSIDIVVLPGFLVVIPFQKQFSWIHAPQLNYFAPLFQNESSSCTNLSYENEFDLHENEFVGRTHFHMNGFILKHQSQLGNDRF